MGLRWDANERGPKGSGSSPINQSIERLDLEKEYSWSNTSIENPKIIDQSKCS